MEHTHQKEMTSLFDNSHHVIPLLAVAQSETKDAMHKALNKLSHNHVQHIKAAANHELHLVGGAFNKPYYDEWHSVVNRDKYNRNKEDMHDIAHEDSHIPQWKKMIDHQTFGGSFLTSIRHMAHKAIRGVRKYAPVLSKILKVAEPVSKTLGVVGQGAFKGIQMGSDTINNL